MCGLGGLSEEVALQKEPVEGGPRLPQVEGPEVRVCELSSKTARGSVPGLGWQEMGVGKVGVAILL